MPYLTHQQVKTAEMKAADFGKAALYIVPPFDDDEGNAKSYADAICTFEDSTFVLIIHPDGQWDFCDLEWTTK